MLAYLRNQTRRIFRAFFHSIDGLVATWREDASVLQWSVLAVFMVPLGLYLGRDGVEKAMLAAAILACPIAELINTAIEVAIDRISPENHPLSKKAKDVGSAIVLITASGAAMVWVLVLVW